MRSTVCSMIVWLMITIELGSIGKLDQHHSLDELVLLSTKILTIILNSLLKKVTKEHFKEDFDSLFKHLSSNSKTVGLNYFLDRYLYYIRFSSETMFRQQYSF